MVFALALIIAVVLIIPLIYVVLGALWVLMMICLLLYRVFYITPWLIYLTITGKEW